MNATKTTLPFLTNWTIDEDKLPKYTLFEKEFIEDADMKLCNLILDTDDERIPKESKELFRTSVVRNIADNKLTVKYENRKGLGRVYANNDVGLTPQSRFIKNTIYAYHKYRDIDMKKSYPNIILSIAENNGLELSAYEYYLNNFDTIVEDLIQYYSKLGQPRLMKDQVKWLFSMIIFGGGFSTWKKGLENPQKKDIAKGYKPVFIEDKPLPVYVENFKFQTEQIINLIDRNNPNLRKRLWDSHKSRYENTNSLMSYFLGVIENHILYNSTEFLMNEGVISFPRLSLAYDGKSLPPFKVNKKDDDIMRDLNTHIRTLTGLNRVEFIFKEFPPDTVLSHLIRKREAMEDTPNKPENAYLEWKAEFELTHSKIINTSSFIKCVKDKKGFISEYKVFNKTSLITSYEHMTVDIPKVMPSGKTVMKTKICISEWLNDKNIKKYEDVDVVPPPLICPNNILNLWTPFYVEQLPESKEFLKDSNKEEYIGKTEAILNHIRILCNHNEDDYIWMVRWIGQMLKLPAIKTFCPTFISKEGAGKGTLIYLLERLLGKSKVFETTNPAQYVWGNFNELMQGAFVVNCDELDAKSQLDCDGKIKGLITNNNLTINPKGQKSYRIQSYHRFIYTTNKEVPVQTHSKDRRNKIIRTSDELIENKEYFDNLRKDIDDDVVIRMLYEFLVAQDVDSFHLENIVQNDYQQTMSEYNIPIPEQFLENMTREFANESSKEFTSVEIYNKFEAWKTSNNIKYECDSAKLLRNLQLIQVPNWYSKRKTAKDRFTIINFSVLRTHFGIGLDSVLASEIDEEETDTEYVEEE